PRPRVGGLAPGTGPDLVGGMERHHPQPGARRRAWARARRVPGSSCFALGDATLELAGRAALRRRHAGVHRVPALRGVDHVCGRARALLPHHLHALAGARGCGPHAFSLLPVRDRGHVESDYVVRPDWLRAVIGHFADSKVAFVQTPQNYRDWTDDQYLRGLYYSYRYFFEITMPSRAHRNAIIFAGTMGLIRRSALEEI